jgi:excisionase family DNA binding protein
MGNGLAPLKFLTVGEAAELLQVSRRTLHRMIHCKELPAFKVGGQWRIHEEALIKWLDELHALRVEARVNLNNTHPI